MLLSDLVGRSGSVVCCGSVYCMAALGHAAHMWSQASGAVMSTKRRGLSLVVDVDRMLVTALVRKFPSLRECEAVVRRSVEGHRLTEWDRHIIGTLWAYLERVVLDEGRVG